MLTTGVSQLDKRSPEVILEPNENYWDPARRPSSRIVFDNIVSKSDALKSVASGDGKIDVVTSLTPADAKAFNGGDRAKIVSSPAKTVLVAIFNENKPGSVWANKALRQAMNMAVDRDAMIRDAAGGYGMVIPAMIQPGRYGFNKDIASYKLDAAKAGPVIKAANIPGNTVIIAGGPDDAPVVAALTKDLAAVGLKVTARLGDAAVQGTDWDLKVQFHFDWTPEFPVGVVHREFFGKDGGFRAMPVDAGFDTLYSELLKTEPSKQEPIVRKVEQYVHDKADVLFLYSPNTLAAVSNRVHFVPYETFMLELAETGVNKKASSN